MRGHSANKTQKTVRLPRPLLKEAESLIRRGDGESLNDFIVRSMRLRIEVSSVKHSTPGLRKCRKTRTTRRKLTSWRRNLPAATTGGSETF